MTYEILVLRASWPFRNMFLFSPSGQTCSKLGKGGRTNSADTSCVAGSTPFIFRYTGTSA